MKISSIRIDAHQHFWNYHPAVHDWITPEMKRIRQTFLPADLAPVLEKAGFDACVTVQTDQSKEETETLLAWAHQYPFIKGVVGWVDLRAADITEKLARLHSNPSLKGFRHIVQSEPAGFLLHPDFLHGMRSLARYNFTFDLLVLPPQLDETIEFVRRLPNQKFVLDHLAKPNIHTMTLEPWRTKIHVLAKEQNVFCKLSGMVTEAGWNGPQSPAGAPRKHLSKDLFVPYLEAALAAFGPQRLLYGSDWPVCLVAAEYEEQFSIVNDFICQLTLSERQGILGDNAVHFYNL